MMLLGLVTKNAILLVDIAQPSHRPGAPSAHVRLLGPARRGCARS